MELLTQEIYAKLLANGRRQQPLRGTAEEIDFEPVVKLTNQYGWDTFLLTEIDPDHPDTAFGLVQTCIDEPELGPVPLEMIRQANREGFGIRMDPDFKATKTLSAYAEEASRLGYVA